jgi:SAM-dependent methyltransferase
MMGVASNCEIPDGRAASRRAWDQLAKIGCFCSEAYGTNEFKNARSLLDFAGWIPWHEINTVLCLAAGGGQQSLLFASLGYRVTVVDLSPEQLTVDRTVAEQNGFEVECIEGDMLNIDRLLSRQFDLVYQPISAHYANDVRRLYRVVRKVVRPGGFYWVEHWSPFQMQLAAIDRWDSQAYRLVEPQRSGKPIPWIVTCELSPKAPNICWHYVHSLNELIGGMCDAGFKILRFAEREQKNLNAEPGSEAHLAAYLPPFLAIFGQRMAAKEPQRRAEFGSKESRPCRKGISTEQA